MVEEEAVAHVVLIIADDEAADHLLAEVSVAEALAALVVVLAVSAAAEVLAAVELEEVFKKIKLTTFKRLMHMCRPF